MDARLQRRIQRYGWDRAAPEYEALWQAQLAPAQGALLEAACLRPGEQVLDVACGTGLVTLAAARAVGLEGRVTGVDLSQAMVDVARQQAAARELPQTHFARMDAEHLSLPDGSFDVVLCALGLMYVPDVRQALREMRRVLRSGGRLVLAVWGERDRCGWAGLFEIVDAEVESEVCPLFFDLGRHGSLADAVKAAGFERALTQRVATTLVYEDGSHACRAAFVAGPVALAWARADEDARIRMNRRYLESLAPWRCGSGYRVPGEFVIVSAARPATPEGGRSGNIGATNKVHPYETPDPAPDGLPSLSTG